MIITEYTHETEEVYTVFQCFQQACLISCGRIAKYCNTAPLGLEGLGSIPKTKIKRVLSFVYGNRSHDAHPDARSDFQWGTLATIRDAGGHPACIVRAFHHPD